jgi:alkaline phosphatase
MKVIKRLLQGHLVAIAVVLTFLSPSIAGEARNIILMIGDGMGPAQFHAMWFYSARFLGRDCAMTEIMNQGKTGYMYNDSLDSSVPESAGAATQMATGVKVHTKTISVGSDNKPLKSILEIAKEKGKTTGLVTTSGITDATPAAFAAHVKDRRDEHMIAEQLVKSDVNILFGGGRAFFLSETEKGSKRKDSRNLVEEARKKGYKVVETADEMKKATGKKLLGLFNNDNMLFETDRFGSNEPSLAEMTGKALDVLKSNKDGFFLMVEGSRIDNAAHRNDIAALVFEGIAFDEAVKVAYEFQKRNTDTLLIITGDHETGGLAVLSQSPIGREREGINHEAMSTFLSRLSSRSGWATKSHTATPLFVWGIGPGSEKITGWKHNTELFKVMRDAYGF